MKNSQFGWLFKILVGLILILQVISYIPPVSAHHHDDQLEKTPDDRTPAGLTTEEWAQITGQIAAGFSGEDVHWKDRDVGTGDLFGVSVAISGDTLVVGVPQEDSDGSSPGNNDMPSSGAAYVFVRSGTTWKQQAYLKANNVGASDLFGHAVAISGDTLVVGAHFEDSDGKDPQNNNAENSGAAYVFARSGTTWLQQAYLKASNAEASDFFGQSVAISGTTVVVGANGEDSTSADPGNNDAFGAGAAYVFVRSVNDWKQQAYLKASNADPYDGFGYSVGISNNLLVVGANCESSSSTDPSDNSASCAGAAYLYVRKLGVWKQLAYLKASNADVDDCFGWSVAISGTQVVVGAPYEKSNGSDPGYNLMWGAGAAYVFVQDGPIWTEEAYLKASIPNESDLFGISVAISGDTVVIGADGEDSDGTGESNDNAVYSGAAYVFARGDGSWPQAAFLKAANVDSGDRYGTSVGISGNSLVIGAPWEDSDGKDPLNNNAENSGAAYVLVNSTRTWSQQSFLKALMVGLMDMKLFIPLIIH